MAELGISVTRTYSAMANHELDALVSEFKAEMPLGKDLSLED